MSETHGSERCINCSRYQSHPFKDVMDGICLRDEDHADTRHELDWCNCWKEKK